MFVIVKGGSCVFTFVSDPCGLSPETNFRCTAINFEAITEPVSCRACGGGTLGTQRHFSKQLAVVIVLSLRRLDFRCTAIVVQVVSNF